MLYALVNGIKELPKKGLVGICPSCDEQLIPKCGTINIHHWSHKKNSDCEYRNDNDMCQWHKDWQDMFDKENQEVWIKKHISECNYSINGKIKNDYILKRSDIHINNTFIEIQHSPISSEELLFRDNFYENIIWIFDGNTKDFGYSQDIFQDEYYHYNIKYDRTLNSSNSIKIIDMYDSLFILLDDNISIKMLKNKFVSFFKKYDYETFEKILIKKTTMYYLNKYRMGFGKYKSQRIIDIYKKDKKYLNWVIKLEHNEYNIQNIIEINRFLFLNENLNTIKTYKNMRKFIRRNFYSVKLPYLPYIYKNSYNYENFDKK